MIQNEWIEKLSVDEDPNEVSSKSKTAISSTNHFPSTTQYLLTYFQSFSTVAKPFSEDFT